MRRERDTGPLAAHSIDGSSESHTEPNLFRSHGQRSSIAVEFSKTALRIAQLSAPSSAPSVCATAILPPVKGIFDAGPVDDASVRRLRETLKHGRFSGSACAMALPASSVFSEAVEVPALASEELRESVSWVAVDRLGVERGDLVSGHLPIRNGTLGGTAQEVLVIASQRAMVARAIAFLTHAGLETRRAELGSAAAMRLCWNMMKDSGRVPSFGFLHLESDRATLALLNLHGLTYFRSFEWESSAVLHAELIPVAGAEDQSQAWRWRQLGEQVLQCLRHVERRAPGSWPELIRVSGPLAEEPGVASAIGSVCGAATEVFDSSHRVDWSHAPTTAGGRAAWNAALALVLPSPAAPSAVPSRRVA